MIPKIAKKKISVSKLKEKLWKLFSEYIRRKYSVNGMTECYTCRTTKPWQEMQCGHFISRRHSNTLFDEDNNRPQCYSCNCLNQGNAPKYAQRLIVEQGSGIIDELVRRSNISKQFKPAELEELIEIYKRKLLSLNQDI